MPPARQPHRCRAASWFLLGTALAGSSLGPLPTAGVGVPDVESLRQRNLQLLQTMRSSPLVFQSNSSEHVASGAYRVIGQRGEEFHCAAKQLAPEDGSGGSGNGEAVSDVPAAAVAAFDRLPTLQLLRGTCVTRTEGYWTYEWCHRRQVSQYHVKKNGQRAAENVLGVYVSTDAADERGDVAAAQHDTDHAADHATPAAVTDRYAQGDNCDVDTTPPSTVARSVEVVLQCCDGVTTRRGGKLSGAAAAAVSAVASNQPAILSIQEPSTCAYKLDVCVPQLCPPKSVTAARARRAAAAAAAVAAGAPADPVEVVRALDPTTCLHRSEGWWTYELCYHDKVRQLHVETVAVDQGKIKTSESASATTAQSTTSATTVVAKNLVQRVTQAFVLGKNQEGAGATPTAATAAAAAGGKGEGDGKRGQGNKKGSTGGGKGSKGAKSRRHEQAGRGGGGGGGGGGGASAMLELRTELALDPTLPSAFVVQQFAGGDFCGKAGQRRSVEVRYTCMPVAGAADADGPTAATAGNRGGGGAVQYLRASEIVSVEEERTCHYVALVHLQELCHLEAFRRQAPPQFEISCSSAAAVAAVIDTPP